MKIDVQTPLTGAKIRVPTESGNTLDEVIVLNKRLSEVTDPSPLTGEEELSKVLREMDEVWKEWIETSNPAALANWNCYALEVVPALRAKNKELTDKLKTAQEALETYAWLDEQNHGDTKSVAHQALASIRSSPSV